MGLLRAVACGMFRGHDRVSLRTHQREALRRLREFFPLGRRLTIAELIRPGWYPDEESDVERLFAGLDWYEIYLFRRIRTCAFCNFMHADGLGVIFPGMVMSMARWGHIDSLFLHEDFVFMVRTLVGDWDSDHFRKAFKGYSADQRLSLGYGIGTIGIRTRQSEWLNYAVALGINRNLFLSKDDLANS